MSDLENDSKLELERLRLASDLRQLAKETRNLDLKDHCLRMAKHWSGEVDEPAHDDSGIDQNLVIDGQTSRQSHARRPSRGE